MGGRGGHRIYTVNSMYMSQYVYSTFFLLLLFSTTSIIISIIIVIFHSNNCYYTNISDSLINDILSGKSFARSMVNGELVG